MDPILNKIPKITVLMPVYNCEPYIEEAVRSILNQTFTDFEFLIIDDFSNDNTVSIIKSIKDSRIILIEKSFNTGLTNSLNLGLNLAKGEYIARMDGDDISLPYRFSKQLNYLDSNPKVILCGTNISIIDTDRIIKFPEKNEEIKMAFLNGNCMAHPSVMIRKNSLQEFNLKYDKSKEPAEDYDFWVRLLGVGELYNFQEVLLNYRVHDFQVSQKREAEQIQTTIDTRLKMLNYLNYSFSAKEYDLLKKVMMFDLGLNSQEIKSFFILKEKMIKADPNNFFNAKAFNEYLNNLQFHFLKYYFLKRDKYYPLIYLRYLKIRNNNLFKLKRLDEFKLLLKSIVCFKRKKND